MINHSLNITRRALTIANNSSSLSIRSIISSSSTPLLTSQTTSIVSQYSSSNNNNYSNNNNSYYQRNTKQVFSKVEQQQQAIQSDIQATKDVIFDKKSFLQAITRKPRIYFGCESTWLTHFINTDNVEMIMWMLIRYIPYTSYDIKVEKYRFSWMNLSTFELLYQYIATKKNVGFIKKLFSSMVDTRLLQRLQEHIALNLLANHAKDHPIEQLYRPFCYSFDPTSRGYWTYFREIRKLPQPTLETLPTNLLTRFDGYVIPESRECFLLEKEITMPDGKPQVVMGILESYFKLGTLPSRNLFLRAISFLDNQADRATYYRFLVETVPKIYKPFFVSYATLGLIFQKNYQIGLHWMEMVAPTFSNYNIVLFGLTNNSEFDILLEIMETSALNKSYPPSHNLLALISESVLAHNLYHHIPKLLSIFDLSDDLPVNTKSIYFDLLLKQKLASQMIELTEKDRQLLLPITKNGIGSKHTIVNGMALFLAQFKATTGDIDQDLNHFIQFFGFDNEMIVAEIPIPQWLDIIQDLTSSPKTTHIVNPFIKSTLITNIHLATKQSFNLEFSSLCLNAFGEDSQQRTMYFKTLVRTHRSIIISPEDKELLEQDNPQDIHKIRSYIASTPVFNVHPKPKLELCKPILHPSLLESIEEKQEFLLNLKSFFFKKINRNRNK
ncbi:hypothetical protein DFA_00761 [Cavenderia fasciculata]|uniref:Uncharacterized protein n=1 Tax=Cavenderia fasciculata TaxID=261658 RepID=F4PTL4_CACFS|nr:uncharacterized protein DFA_00761 [Cavenderia fasciculata]EGG20896.1 hypothetical protein DFA_00761 [Cavenderia fasciculata]|eukprot:XP_004358746.1 hypothetical protein DFA_00761 [Cavenderia fasciculata]